MLNIYIFNTFVAKIITSYLTFVNKVHEIIYIYIYTTTLNDKE
jgi:hypothetical protein